MALSDDYMKEFGSSCNKVLGDMFHLLQEKHKKYGNKSITKGSYDGIIHKIDMKLERLRQLVANRRDLDEMTELQEWRDDVKDQLIDIANYGALGLMLLDGLFPRGN